MNKKLTFFAFFLFLLSSFPITLEAGDKVVVSNPKFEEISARKLDREALILASYLARFNSPLQYHAQDFIDAAKTYELDWKMVPSIAGVESTFGKQIPGGYNAWGWGVYGNQAIYFSSWREAIFTVSEGLKKNYINKGLRDPYSMNKIYAQSPHWGRKVTYFMNDLEKYAKNYQADAGLLLQIPSSKIAAFSGTVTLD